LMIFSRLNGSVAPERFTTDRLAVSTVVNRRLQAGHWRRRRIDKPSSDVRESTTRESACRQKGQCTGFSSPGANGTRRVPDGDRFTIVGHILEPPRLLQRK
jgi:uncharacterized Ntn-hydrolase superfamily protein